MRSENFKTNKFTGKTWQELEDIWPKNYRMDMKEVYGVISVMAPAMVSFRASCCQKYGNSLRTEDLFLLFWIQRCEEARDNVGTNDLVIKVPMQYHTALFAIKKSRLYAFQLIERYPGKGPRTYRVTADGKLLLREFAELLEQAHRDVRYLAANAPEEIAKKITRQLSKFVFDWPTFDFKTPSNENLTSEVLERNSDRPAPDGCCLECKNVLFQRGGHKSPDTGEGQHLYGLDDL